MAISPPPSALSQINGPCDSASPALTGTESTALGQPHAQQEPPPPPPVKICKHSGWPQQHHSNSRLDWYSCPAISDQEGLASNGGVILAPAGMDWFCRSGENSASITSGSAELAGNGVRHPPYCPCNRRQKQYLPRRGLC